jgi:hypothetical protein
VSQGRARAGRTISEARAGRTISQALAGARSASPRQGRPTSRVAGGLRSFATCSDLWGLEIALVKQEIKDLALANAIATGMVASGGLLVILDVLVAV